ncbi:MAG: ABC transporter permease [candidate division NC10 bacterium]
MKVKLIRPGILPGLVTLVAFLLLWKLVSYFFLPAFLPAPLELVDRTIEVFGEGAAYLVVWKTFSRILMGLILSMLIGTGIGLGMGLRRNIEAFFDSWIMVLLTFPAIGWAFLAVLWFGISDLVPIMTIVLIVFPFVAMNVWEGTKAMDKELIDMASAYGANRRLTVRKVLIPQLMPYLFSSLQIAFALSWKIALVGEAFGVSSGVGRELFYWFQDIRVDMMLAWGVSFMLVMVLIDVLVFRRWKRRSFAWRQPVR